MYLPDIKPDWSLLITLSMAVFMRLAIEADVIMYIVFNRHIGLELVKISLDLFFLGI